MNEPRYNADLEFETLRNELLQGKKYVFERPLLIFTGGFAFIQFLEEQYAVFFPAIIIGLLFFNLWFSVNRIISIARIVGYIQLVLEDNSIKWRGWETSLRKYRRWIKENKDEANSTNLNNTEVYDNLGYYPTIYYMHIIINVVTIVALMKYTYCNYCNEYLIITIITSLIFVVFIIYTVRNTPAKVKTMIEKKRHTWTSVISSDWDKA